MAAFNKFQQFVEDLAKKKHDLSSDTLKILLTNTAPVATNAVKADLTEIAAGNGYAAGGTAVTGVTAEQTTGTLTVTANDVVFTASGGSMAAWRYAVLYNDTAAGDPLIGWWDRGSAVTLAAGEFETLSIADLFTIV